MHNCGPSGGCLVNTRSTFRPVNLSDSSDFIILKLKATNTCLDAEGITGGLFISDRAHLVLDFH